MSRRSRDGGGSHDRDDDFDEIVQHLQLDFPSLPGAELGGGNFVDPTDHRSLDHDPDEAFYRRVDPAEPQPADPRRSAAIAALIGSPALMVVFSMLHIVLPRAIVVGLGLTFVAGAIYLIARLPERGPGHPDSPDDGAAL